MTANGRWKFHDPEAVLPDYSFHVNPNAQDPADIALFADTPVPTNDDGSQGVVTIIQAPQSWTFGGTATTQDQLDKFEDWLDNGRNIEVTDHFGQVWLIQLLDISTITRKNAHHSGARINWTLSTLMIGRVS